MAKTTIGVLNVRLTAQTAAFSQGMAKAQKKTRAFSVGLKKVGTAVATFGAASIAAASAALVTLTKRQFETIDAMAKLSDRMNITTQDVAALQYASKLGGVEMATMDQSIEGLVRRLGEAKRGSGAAAKTFDRLGLSADKLSQMTTGDAFREVAESIRVLPTAADKAAAANDLFGRSGVKMLSILNQGSKGLDDARKATLMFGTAVDRKTAAKIEAANDSVTMMNESLRGFGVTIAAKVAPHVSALAKMLANFLANNKTLALTLRAVGKTAVNYTADFLSGAQLLIVTAIKLRRAVLQIGEASLKASSAFAGLAAKIDPTGIAAKSLAYQQDQLKRLQKERKMVERLLKVTDGQDWGVKLRMGMAAANAEAERFAQSIADAAASQAELERAALGIGGPSHSGRDRFQQITLSRTAIGRSQSAELSWLEKISSGIDRLNRKQTGLA